MSVCMPAAARVTSDGGVADLRTDAGMRAVWVAHAPGLRAFASQRLGDRELAEDAVQETFLRAWRKAHLFDAARGSVRSWLYAILRNVVVDMFRARLVRPPHDTGVPDRAARDEIDGLLSSLTMDEAMGRLSAPHREVIVQCYVRQRSHGEVAALLGVPVGTVRSRLFYARAALGCVLREIGALDTSAA